MYGYTCSECGSYWESYQSIPDLEWCSSCGTSDVPELWEIPETIGTYDIMDKKESRKPCQYCGTLSGLHSFSFDKNGTYNVV